MVKTLLVYDDFNELTLTESYLKKVGFDVVGVSNEVLIQDQILSFRPDIIVAQGNSSKVSSFSVGQKLKDNQRFQGKVVIIVPKDVRPSPQDLLKMKMDGLIETPVQPEKLIQVLCRLSGLQPNAFVEKFQKARLGDPELKRLIMVTSTVPLVSSNAAAAPATAENSNVSPLSNRGVAIDDPQRTARYKKFTDDVNFDVKQSTHQRQDLKEKQKELKKGWDFDKLEEQDEARREFANALFRKK